MATLPFFLRRRPPPEALHWVERSVGRGARVTSIRRLRGGTSAAVHLVHLRDRQGKPVTVVLRRFVRAEWLAEEPDVVDREALVLSVLERTMLPVPHVLATDATGVGCDVPAILMTRVPGRIDLAPRDLDTYLRELAEFLPALHAIGPAEGVPAYRPWFRSRPFEPPSWSTRPELWLRANELTLAPPPAVQPTLIHRDYHPANVLWRYRHLSGVTDWVNASIGPTGIDVAHCRVNLSALFGVRVSEDFRRIYESIAGVEQHPYWDLLDALDTGPPTEEQWHDAGRFDLSGGIIRQRCEEYLESLVRALS